MANRFLDGFDHYATADLTRMWSSLVSGPTITANGRNGGSCLEMANFARGVVKNLDSQATWIIGFAFRTSALPANFANGQFVTFIDTGTSHVDFRLGPAGTIQATRHGTALGTGTAVIAVDTWTYLEFKVTISDTVGVVVTKVNGVTDLNLSSQDTRNGANASANIIQIIANGSASATIRLDDLYIHDGTGGVDDDFWGDIRIVAKSVDGAGNSAQFTPSTGSNWQNVDDATPNGDTDYNESSTVNHIDSMTTAALGVTGTVKGVNLLAYARKTDAGVGSLAPLWRISGTDYPGTGVALSTDYTYVSQLYRVSPATSSAFTTSEIDGAEIGYKRTA